MVFVNGKSIALATSHSLSLSGNTTDTSNKDTGDGHWASAVVNSLSWTAQSDNMYSTEGYEALFTHMIARTPVTLVFTVKSGNVLPETGWEPAVNTGYSGQAYITSLDANAANGDNATFSVTFTGVGALELLADK